MHLITERILLKFVNDSVCRYFPLSSNPEKHNFSITATVSMPWSNVQEAHTLFHPGESAILFKLNSSEHDPATCHLTMVTEAVNKQYYFLSIEYLMMHIVQKLGNSKCNTQLSEFFIYTLV